MSVENDWKCDHCNAIFPTRTKVGACPCCGAPGPTRLEAKEKQVIIINNYYEVDKPAPRNSTIPRRYYLPPGRSFKSKLYSTLGFWLTTGLSVVAVLVVIYVFIQALKLGKPGELTNEELRKTAPTAVIVEAIDQNQTKWWETSIEDWLTSNESMSLQEKSNVVNLIVLDSDEIKIATNATLKLDESWVQTRPYFVEAISVIGTQAIVQIGGTQYNLNVYMPFVWKNTPEQIAMIDINGMLWVLDSENVSLVEIDSVDLPIYIEPNPNLEIVFSKQQ